MITQLIYLVKIAKQKLDTQEKLLLRNQILIQRKREDIDAINLHIASVPIPSSGSFSSYQSHKDSIGAYLHEIEEIQNQIAILRQEQEHIKNEIKKAHLEHEKMLHIYNKTKEEQQIMQNKKEIKNLDETTTILYARQNIIRN